jgi:hypothetical protein
VYDFKKISKWLIIIPFFVIHVFGSPSIVSNLFCNNVLSGNFVTTSFFGFFGSSCEEDAYKRLNSLNKKDINIEVLSTENSCNNFLKNFFDKVKKPKGISNDVFVCDNRIDSIDKNFSKIIYPEDLLFLEKSLVVFV